MEEIDIIIIGAGIIGLAIAEKLSKTKKEIVVIERFDSFGRETSSRNSEVIHGGMYYPENSLKTRFCVEGNKKIYSLCEKNNIPYLKSGKLIISDNQKEEVYINKLYQQGIKNGVEGLKLLTKNEVFKMEPEINCTAALFSKETGIIDTHELMNYLEKNAKKEGVIFAYNCEAAEISKENGYYNVKIIDADKKTITVRTKIIINCGGLYSDKIAKMAGIDIDKWNYKIHPCKGEYYNLSNKHKGKVKRLIYPVPTDISLGIHIVLDLSGQIKLGPSVYYVKEIDYTQDSSYKNYFFENVKSFIPFIEKEDITPAMTGIRPKLQKENGKFRDFIINEESDKNLPGLINLIGIESPGLTSALSIADYAAEILHSNF